jgi:hypothetical protein
MDDVVALHAFPLPTERYHAFLLNISLRTLLTLRRLHRQRQRDGRLILEDHEGEFMFFLLSQSATNANNVSTHPFCTLASTIFHHPPHQARPSHSSIKRWTPRALLHRQPIHNVHTHPFPISSSYAPAHATTSSAVYRTPVRDPDVLTCGCLQ